MKMVAHTLVCGRRVLLFDTEGKVRLPRIAELVRAALTSSPSSEGHMSEEDALAACFVVRCHDEMQLACTLLRLLAEGLALDLIVLDSLPRTTPTYWPHLPPLLLRLQAASEAALMLLVSDRQPRPLKGEVLHLEPGRLALGPSQWQTAINEDQGYQVLTPLHQVPPFRHPRFRSRAFAPALVLISLLSRLETESSLLSGS